MVLILILALVGCWGIGLLMYLGVKRQEESYKQYIVTQGICLQKTSN